MAKEYYTPPQNLKLAKLADVPMWVREHYRQEALKETIETFRRKLCDCKNTSPHFITCYYCDWIKKEFLSDKN